MAKAALLALPGTVFGWVKDVVGFSKTPDGKRVPQNMQEAIDELPPIFHYFMASEMPYRRLSALSFLLIVALLGGPLWWTTTRTYRAPFPTFENNQTVPLRIKVVLAVTNETQLVDLETVKSILLTKLADGEVDQPLSIQWEVDNIGIRDLESLVSERGSSSSAEVQVALVPSAQWPHFSATHVHLGKGKWALVQWRNEEPIEKSLHRIWELVWEVMVDVPHLNVIVRRDSRERMQPWQIATLPLSHQKRLVWDSAPLSMHYIVQLIHVHDNASPSTVPATQTTGILRKFAAKLSNITKLEVISEHLWDAEILSYLEKDVQDRLTMSHESMERLIKQVDDQLQTTESPYPLLRIAILETDEPVVMLDQYDDDSKGAAVAAWGAVIPRCDSTDARVLAALRVLLGIDAELTPGWEREPVPLTDWETDRMHTRAFLDNTMRAMTAIRTLQALTEKITTLVVEDEVAARATEAVRLISLALTDSGEPSLELASVGRRLADEALAHPSLLSLLYFPQDQKVAVYMPIMLPVLIPTIGSLWTLIKWLVNRATQKPKAEVWHRPDQYPPTIFD